MRVPDRLELAERLDQLGAEHLRQQFALGLPVAVLAGQRAAIGQAEVGGLLHIARETARRLRRSSARKSSGHARSRRRNGRTACGIAVALVELVEVAQIVAEPFGRHRGVFPGRPGLFVSGDAARPDADSRAPPRSRCCSSASRKAASRRARADPLAAGAKAFSALALASFCSSPPNSTSSQAPASRQQLAPPGSSCPCASCSRRHGCRKPSSAIGPKRAQSRRHRRRRDAMSG